MPLDSESFAKFKDLEDQLIAKEDGMDVVPILRLPVSPSPGEVVRLRGGGPALTVVSARANNMVEVTWHVGNGKLMSATLPVTCLKYVLSESKKGGAAHE